MQTNESDVRMQMHDISEEIRRIDETMMINYQHISKCDEYLSYSAIYDNDVAAREQDMQRMLQRRMDLTMQLRKLNTKLVVQRRNMRTYFR